MWPIGYAGALGVDAIRKTSPALTIISVADNPSRYEAEPDRAAGEQQDGNRGVNFVQRVTSRKLLAP